MTSTAIRSSTIRIGVFAAQEGWLLAHPDVRRRFDRREDAMAAAERLARLESWRGREVDLLVQEPLNAELASFDPRSSASPRAAR